MAERVFRRGVLAGVLYLMLLALNPAHAGGEPTYRFQRLWPQLQQPWYFFRPGGIVLDDNNNIYVADTSNSRIRKFSSDGQYITQFGRPGFEPGELNFPRGLAVGPDPDGEERLYVADTDNGRVQVFSLSGQALREIDIRVNGTGAPFPPTGVAVDEDANLYVTAGDNLRVQKITPAGEISEYVGDGTADPTVVGCAPDLIPCGWSPGIAVDNQGHVFVADPVNFRVIRLSTSLEFQLSFGEAGQPIGGSGASFNTPFGLAVAANGDVIATDVFNGRIHRFDNDGNFLGLFGEPGTEPGQLGEIEGVAVGNHGNIYVADTSNDRIQKFTPDGRLVNQIGSQGNRTGFFAFPSDVAVDGDGNVYVTDTDNYRVQKFQSDGAFERAWGEEGRGAPSLFVRPQGIAVHPNSGRIYVADTESSDSGTAPRFQVFENDGTYFGEQEIFDVAGAVGVRDETVFPTGMAIDGNGIIFVVETSFVNFIDPDGDNDPVRHRVQRFEPGVGVTSFGSFGEGDGEFDGPQDIAVDSAGNVYVADTFNYRIQKFDNTGNFIRAWGSFGDHEGEFDEPEGLAIGPDGNVYVADSKNNRIQVFTSDGAFVSVIGGPGDSPGQFLQPSGLDFGPDGTLYVADGRHNRIQCFVPTNGAAENKAIIIASGGDVADNPLWTATQMLANMAYRTLEHQGFRKENIRYHSADTSLDLDSNGFADDILPLTTADLEATLNTWALGANNVFIYMTGLGQRDLFRLNSTEVLRKEVLDARLDTLGDAISGGMFIVYDASQSGSFIDDLSDVSHGRRIVVTSTAADEAAYFLSGGTVSFSYPLFQGLFSGTSFGQTANDVRSASSFIRAYQSPQVDRNGNGIANEDEDILDIARQLFSGVDSFDSLPFLAAGTPDFALA
ncbi:MAG: 6-bladed beta-propeller, partial [Candidatus Hydrogenedentes bacterium]|nr:6-bladed beta-propeller [Candidatus Hydrogenedentota bacterium]